LFEACADFFMADRLAALDLCQAFLDFAQEPVVVVDQSFDRLLGQRLGLRSASCAIACELVRPE
jgi:hypothetical protein